MNSFKNFISGYLAYELTNQSREELIHKFSPKYSEVICNHVTVKFPAKSTDNLPENPKEAHVIGYADSKDGIEALVVEINGHKQRSDGKLYHITLSLDRHLGKKPVHSNDLVNKNFDHISPIAIHLIPKFISN